jgi:transcriptional regulator with XRE-family HTH domain
MGSMRKPSEIFKDRLRSAREVRGLSQSELAAKAGLPASSISHFEAGSRKPSFDNLRRLAMALEASTDYLLGRVDDLTQTTEADPLYRDLKNLSESDRQAAKAFLKHLAQTKKDRDE